MNRIVAGIAIAALGIFTLVGCSQGNLTAQSVPSDPQKISSQSSSSSSTSSSFELIGTGDASVQVTNGTGYDIVAVRIKPTDANQFTEENSFEGFDFADGSTVELRFTETPKAQTYDIVLITSNDSKIGVRGVDLLHSKDLTFRFEEGIGFATFVDPQTGEGNDTRDASIDFEIDSDALPLDLQGDVG